jgi:hypothetical protein
MEEKNKASQDNENNLIIDEQLEIAKESDLPEVDIQDVEDDAKVYSENENIINESLDKTDNDILPAIDTVEHDEENEITSENICEEKQDEGEKIQSFDDKYHKILFYLQKTIESSSDIPLSILKIQLTNTDNLEKQIEGFKIDIFISDIQFIVMNIVGANGLVSMFDDFSIYAILPEADSEIANMLLDKITSDIKNMFNEIFGECDIEFANSSVNYPEDSRDFAQLFYLAQNGK